MTEPLRYDATIENETLFVEGETEQIEIGSMETILELMGGETYTLEYEPRQSAVSWLSTDENDTITLDVREGLVDWAYPEELVASVRERPLDRTDEDGYPIRTAVFVDVVTAIWDSKGTVTP